MTHESSHAPLGVLEEQVLVAVLRMRDDAFGMSVRRELERVTDREVAIGAVYATLDRLEGKGLLASSRRSSGGGTPGAPSRRIFRVSAEGLRALAATRAMRDRLWHGIDLARVMAMPVR